MSRKSIAFAAALLAWGVGSIGMLSQGFAQEAEKSSSKPLLQAGGSPGEQRIKKTLEEDKTSLDFVDVPLKEVLISIGDKHKLDIQYDVGALRTAAIDPTAIPVTFNVKDVHLQAALKLILSQNNLTYIIQDDVLQVTTKDKANTTSRTVIYDVHDLIPRNAGRPDFQSLIGLTQSWSNAKGVGTIAGFGLGSLIISQTAEIHEEIADLLQVLRGVAEEMKSGKIQDSVVVGKDSRVVQFEQALDKQASLDAVEEPLTKVIHDLLHAEPINVAYDQVALRDAAVDPTALPVSGKFKNLPLRSILRLLLSQGNLTYIFQDEVLLITTKDKAYTTLTTRVYPVNDLLKVSPTEEPSADEADAGISALLETVQNTVASITWSQVGGPGTIDPFDKNGYILIVSQTDDVHDEIADLLKNLRTMHKQQLDAAAREQAQPKTPETAVLKVYDLKVSAPNAPAMTPQEVMEVIKGLTDAKAWSTPDAYIRGATGKLIVRQTPTVHRQIEKLLNQLGAAVPRIGYGQIPVVGRAFGGGGF